MRPCSYLGDAKRLGKCNPMQIECCMSRISGPFLDRIDLPIEVPAVPFQELSTGAEDTSSAAMREQVVGAPEVQQHRFSRGAGTTGTHRPGCEGSAEVLPFSASADDLK